MHDNRTKYRIFTYICQPIILFYSIMYRSHPSISAFWRPFQDFRGLRATQVFWVLVCIFALEIPILWRTTWPNCERTILRIIIFAMTQWYCNERTFYWCPRWFWFKPICFNSAINSLKTHWSGQSYTNNGLWCPNPLRTNSSCAFSC